MALRKKSDSGSKRILKEKVVQIYERFFQGEDVLQDNPNFWDELFLLKPNIAHLEAEVQKLNGEQILQLKPHINRFFAECIKTLSHEHHIRILYALQTLSALTSSMYKKSYGDCGFDIINILMGFDIAEKRMHQLLNHCNDFLVGDWPNSLKSICLKLLLIIVTGTDNVSQNTLLEYLMMDSILDTLMKLLCNSNTRLKFGYDVIMLLTLLVNYRKYESANPYVVKLSILDNELALNGYGLVITHSLAKFCQQFALHQQEPQSVKWFTSLTSIVGNIFVSEDDNTRSQQIRANTGILLALYEIVHLNRNFVTVLAHTQNDIGVESALIDKSETNPPSTDAAVVPTEASSSSEPLNLLITVFQYCSIVMQDTKSEESNNNVKLCFIILTCITEDQYANSLMHDLHLLYKVQLFRMPMRHRQVTQEKSSQPLAATLLDLLTEFMMSHMMKRLPLELYLQCVGIVHRLICYQKKCTIRINYNWKELWEALIMLLKFLLTNENHLSKKINIFNLALQVINIFNLFITYGDTFLASPRSYDLLYYEIIRMHMVFENLYTLAFKYSSIDGDLKDSISKLISSLINVRAIINHFSPKIEKWMGEHSYSTPTEDEILEILRKNYDSLTLKLLDSLDQYERYSEKPYHTSFFTSLVRNVVIDTKQNIDYINLDLQTVLKEFSSIS
ncbi:armadillo-like helical domain-containing protein 3 [Planococcus citri]|uniref:armadillo-like helical domain-containing protein 3 n=1 Tax=Planococcus citri TaxID=170843 RepID=UPI0031F75054